MRVVDGPRAVLAAILLAVASAPAAAQAPGEPLAEQLVISHRGASADRPEHTFAAYDLAVLQDTDMLECDLQLTADDVLVCIHDQTIDRTSDGQGAVTSHTLEELRAFDFGSWFGDGSFGPAVVVPFEEQLDCYLRLNPLTRFHVEAKPPVGLEVPAARPDGPVTVIEGAADYVDRTMEDELVAVLTRKGLVDTGDTRTSTIVVQSFFAPKLEYVKQLAPTLPTGYLNYGVSVDPSPQGRQIEVMSRLGTAPDYVDILIPNLQVFDVDAGYADRFHANGYEVQVWTVNSEADLERAVALGVDGIFTNHTGRARAIVDASGVPTTAAARGNPSTLTPGCPGIAGRVTSKDGPGDVWAARADGPGVDLVLAAEPPPAGPSPAGDAEDPDGGAAPVSEPTEGAASPEDLPATGGGLAAGAAAMLLVATRRARVRRDVV